MRELLIFASGWICGALTVMAACAAFVGKRRREDDFRFTPLRSSESDEALTARAEAVMEGKR